MHIYEYLLAAVVIVVMLVASSTMVLTFSNPIINVSEKEQLKVAAQKLITQILLNPGDPPEWGVDINVKAQNLTSFGLAKSGESTRDAYVLDAHKISRLTLPKDSPFYISPSKVLELLNIEKEYGFALEFYPVLTISIKKVSESLYEVFVASKEDGLPLWNAKVYARVYYYNESSGEIEGSPQVNEVTRIDGKCTLTFNINSNKKILILLVDYYGIRVIHVSNISGANAKRAYLIGNHLHGAPSYSNPIEVMINNIGNMYIIDSVTFTPQKEIEPTTVTVLAVSNEDSKIVYAPLLPIPEGQGEKVIYASIENVQSIPFAYSIERSVTILGSAYIARFTLWRMSF
ncbi:MAG: hypothetical protein QXK78_00710 [Candidatus Bathyarchaeia archaeon]